MSNYTKTVDFAAKDALVTGNPSKAGRGSEVGTEFDNIAISIATKEDVANKGAPSGYAALDSGSKLSSTNLPTTVSTAYWVCKTADTSKSSNITLADDPHLVIAIPAIGTYMVNLVAYTSFNGGGLQVRMNYTGSIGSTSRFFAGGIQLAANYGATASYNSTLVWSTTTTSAVDYLAFQGFLIATSTGTLSLQWAQTTNVAPSSTIFQGASLLARKVS